jgi:hypothetical protein
MRKITNKQCSSRDSVSDAYGALESLETQSFMEELLALSKKHGLVLVPQNRDYDISFEEPMRVVPLTNELEKEIKQSWVCFEV